MSRALAIISFIELGETNEAAELAEKFKDPAGRWKKWANAVVELHAGSVSNATVQFVELKRSDPTMGYLPVEGPHAWDKIDWQLFHKLTSTEKSSP